MYLESKLEAENANFNSCFLFMVLNFFDMFFTG